LTPKLRAELKILAAMLDSEIDTTEMPPITDYCLAAGGPKPARRLARISGEQTSHDTGCPRSQF
jgi:hypothetical protein